MRIAKDHRISRIDGQIKQKTLSETVDWTMNNYKPDLMDMGKTLHKIREEKVFSRA